MIAMQPSRIFKSMLKEIISRLKHTIKEKIISSRLSTIQIYLEIYHMEQHTTQVVRYARVCYRADDFKERVKRLANKLIKKRFTISRRLKNTMKKCIGKHSWMHNFYWWESTNKVNHWHQSSTRTLYQVLGSAALNNSEMSCGCQLMMVVGIVILCWTSMVVGSRSFNAPHRRSTGLL